MAGPPGVGPKYPGSRNPKAPPPSNPYPDHPNAKYVNGKWVVPLKNGAPGLVGPQGVPPKNLKKVSKSAFQKWLAGGTTTTKPGADPSGAFDLNFPDQPALTAYPGLDASTLPDGSEVPDTPAMAFKRTQASLLDPKQFANLEGNKAYAPIIAALTGQQSRLQGGIGDANAMLDKSFGGAADAAARGADVVRNSNATANQGLTDLAARMAQAAGGDPTAAAAVGQATANQQASNTRFADVAAQTQADQAAAANRDLGTAKLAYKGATDSSIADLASKIGQLKLQGSQDQGKALEEALGFNSQQRTAALGRDVSTLEARTAAALAAPQITAANLSIAGQRQGLQLNKHGAQVTDWQNMNTATRQHYLDAVQKVTDKATALQFKQALQKGQTPAAELALADPQAYAAVTAPLDTAFTDKSGPTSDPGTIYSQSIRLLHTTYPDSSPKAIKALAQRYAETQMAHWNKDHPNGGTWKMVGNSPRLVKSK